MGDVPHQHAVVETDVPGALSVVLAGLAGAGLGVLVTVRLHATAGFWSARLWRTRFRRANLPVGGVLALAVAIVVPSVARELLVAAVTMGEAAIAGRYLDPLPSVRSRRAWATSRRVH